jgi:hypothetical protein
LPNVVSVMVVIMDYDMEGHGRYNPEEEGE